MPNRIATLTIAAGFVVCWSSGFVGGRLATEADMPVLALFVWRFLLAALVVGAWWYLTFRRPVSGSEVRYEMLIGSLTMGGYLLGVILALEFGVSAGIAALITALQPLLAAAVAGPLLGERLGRRGWTGMTLALIGVALCVGDDLGGERGAPAWAYALPLLSVASVTLGSLLSVRRAATLPLPVALLAQLIAATGIFLVAALLDGGGKLPPPKPEPLTLAALAWLVVLSSLGGYGFFVASLRRFGVTLTSSLVHLTPGVTLLWAAIMFGERPGTAGMTGMVLAGAGALLAICGVRRSDPTRRGPDARHVPRTWSAGESRGAAHRAPSPQTPY